ncbi:unnamed protein product [Dibothriocephalus latus]|uniref:Uncharacterized protein n=1 Tax=Dibothriocephalus latus TaxID=60516 RepID=A0A3P6TEN1_DIBLA|nr:unnamed protein product [Dibothriocephalus latus]
MYGNVYEDEERNERESLLPHLLSRCAEDFSLSQTDYNNHSVKAGTGRRVARTDKQHPDGEGQSRSRESLKLPSHPEDVSTPELDLSAQRLPGRDSDTISLQETELLMDDFSNCFEKAVASDATYNISFELASNTTDVDEYSTSTGITALPAPAPLGPV